MDKFVFTYSNFADKCDSLLHFCSINATFLFLTKKLLYLTERKSNT